MAGPLSNPKHEAFARHYAAGMDKTVAYVAAGFVARTKAAQASGGSTISERPDVRARVAELMEDAAESTKLDIAKMLETVMAQAFFDPSIFEGVNSVADLKKLVPEQMRRLLVKGWRWDRKGNFIVELVDKDSAIDRLARHLSFYNDKMQIEDLTLTAALDAAERKVAEEARYVGSS